MVQRASITEWPLIRGPFLLRTGFPARRLWRVRLGASNANHLFLEPPPVRTPGGPNRRTGAASQSTDRTRTPRTSAATTLGGFLTEEEAAYTGHVRRYAADMTCQAGVPAPGLNWTVLPQPSRGHAGRKATRIQGSAVRRWGRGSPSATRKWTEAYVHPPPPRVQRMRWSAAGGLFCFWHGCSPPPPPPGRPLLSLSSI